MEIVEILQRAARKQRDKGTCEKNTAGQKQKDSRKNVVKF